MTKPDKIGEALDMLRNAQSPEEMKQARDAVWKIREQIIREASEKKADAKNKFESMKRKAAKQRKQMVETQREAELERKVFFRTRKPSKPNSLRLRKGW